MKKVGYADVAAASKYLADSIDRAKTADHVYELLGEALVALMAVDENAVPQSRRVGCFLRGWRQAKTILADQVKAVRPPRQ